jgi:hypothetical protein
VFICHEMGRDIALTAYAILLKQYELEACLSLPALPFTVVQSDLMFGFVTTPMPADPSSLDWLQGHLVAKHVTWIETSRLYGI